jgi:MFS family permease
LDLIILPLLAIIYFTHSLDRANLGNAKTDNFETDIGLTDNQYSLILILFYIPYGTLNIPATVLAKRFSPAVVVPLLMLCWGAISLGAAGVHNFGGIITARILLGVVEAGFVIMSVSLRVFLVINIHAVPLSHILLVNILHPI